MKTLTALEFVGGTASEPGVKRFVEGEDRRLILLPEYLDDYVSEDNPVRVIDVFVDELDLGSLGFDGVVPEATVARLITPRCC